jgi:hypothetical protein
MTAQGGAQREGLRPAAGFPGQQRGDQRAGGPYPEDC